MARKWWTLLVVCIAIYMLLLDITIVNVALPDISASFHSSLSGLQRSPLGQQERRPSFSLTQVHRPSISL